MEDVPLISLANKTWLYFRSFPQKEGNGLCVFAVWFIRQSNPHLVHLGFIDYTSAIHLVPIHLTQFLSLSVSLHSPLPLLYTLSFLHTHPSLFSPFILFIHTTGSLLIICDLLKYIHCFPLSLSPLLLSMSFISPLLKFPMWTFFSSLYLILSHSLVFYHIHFSLSSSPSYPVNLFQLPSYNLALSLPVFSVCGQDRNFYCCE